MSPGFELLSLLTPAVRLWQCLEEQEVRTIKASAVVLTLSPWELRPILNISSPWACAKALYTALCDLIFEGATPMSQPPWLFLGMSPENPCDWPWRAQALNTSRSCFMVVKVLSVCGGEPTPDRQRNKQTWGWVLASPVASYTGWGRSLTASSPSLQFKRWGC